MDERTNEAFEGDVRLTVVGRQLQPGAQAPAFGLDWLDPDGAEMHNVRLADSAGAVRLLNVVNSLDTPVCHLETRRWDALLDDLPPDVRLYTISMDLPYAQARGAMIPPTPGPPASISCCSTSMWEATYNLSCHGTMVA